MPSPPEGPGSLLFHRRSFLAAVLLGMACDRTGTQVQPRGEVRILAGPPGGGYRAFTVNLLREFDVGLPGFAFTLIERRPPVPDVEQLQQGEADFAITLADRAYRAFTGQYKSGADFSQLRAVSLLDVIPLHLIVRPHLAIRHIRDLYGHSVSMSAAADDNRTAELVLTTFGLDSRSIRVKRYTLPDAAARFASGEVDAMLYLLAYPAESIARGTNAGGRLVPIDGDPISRLLQEHTFLQLARIPAGTYSGNPDSIRTIGVPTILLCRRDLDAGVVYQLTRQFFEILPRAIGSPDYLGQMDLEHAPATPIPLHEGAARYYRERELLR